MGVFFPLRRDGFSRYHEHVHRYHHQIFRRCEFAHAARARAVPVAQQRDSGGDSTQVHEELQHADAWKACAMAALSLTFVWC